jgi:hypothetical protein
MRIYAEVWYDSGAWPFIGVVVGSVIALVGIFVGTRYTVRASDPGRSLLYSMPTVTALVQDQHREHARLEVSRDGNVLSDPQVVVLRLVLHGRQDVIAADFEGGPLLLDIGVPILDLLAISCEPQDSPALPVRVDGSTVRVGPALIHRDEAVSLSVLIDGGRPSLIPPVATLANVRLRPGDTHSNPRGEPEALVRALGLTVVVAVVVMATAATAVKVDLVTAVVAGLAAAAVATVVVEAAAQRLLARALRRR